MPYALTPAAHSLKRHSGKKLPFDAFTRSKNIIIHKKSQQKIGLNPLNLKFLCYDIVGDSKMKKIRKFLKSVIRVIFILALIGCIALASINLYIISYSKQYTLTPQAAAELQDVDCIMVLGCGVYGDDPSPLLADRLQRGVEVFQLGAAPKILMSGDHGQDDYDEVNVMKQFALDKGISEADIFMDHAGFSTYESMYRAVEIFGVKKMIIVTQKYHLSRALYIANKLGIEAYGVASDYRSFGGQFARDCREVLARAKDLYTTVIKPLPTFLGEAIPISGDGTATNG